MSQTTNPEVVFGSQYLVTLGRNLHETTLVDREIGELADLVEEIQINDEYSQEEEQESEDSEREQNIGETSGNIRGKGRARGQARGRGVGRRGRGGMPSCQLPTLPEPPVFTPMHNIQGLHRGYVMLPPDIQLDNNVNILALFKLFFTDEQLQMIVESANEYEQIKGVEGGRPWYPLTLNELKIWFALVIYMGVHKIYAVEDLWNSNEKRAIHSIKEYMTLLRFQQIKRFLHISKPNEPHLCWYSKVEPLASHIREVSKQLYFPSSQVSVDEMIARFSGRSAHTVRMKNKPTPEGYKIFSLCDAGYTYTFAFTSRIEKDMQITPVVGLSKTGGSVWHLVKQLPHHKTFHVYMDNYFSSIPLFKYMHDNGLGACGTVRTNSSKFPKELKINKGISLDWNTISGKVVDDVLAIVWVDNSPVTMLTTIHEIVGEEWKIIRNRRRPRETSSNASTVHRVFGNASRKELSIPKVIDDYNHYMGGVDIADQLRGYYNCQLIVHRNWFPLLFWLLDTVLVNCSLLYNKVVNENVKSKSFRIDLVWGLIKDVMDNDNSISTRSMSTTTCLYDNEESFFPQTKTKSKGPYVTKNFELPISRLLPGNHFPEWREKRGECVYCRYLTRNSRESSSSSSSSSIPQSQLWCIECNVPLCCSKSHPNCFKDFHTNTVNQ